MHVGKSGRSAPMTADRGFKRNPSRGSPSGTGWDHPRSTLVPQWMARIVSEIVLGTYASFGSSSSSTEEPRVQTRRPRAPWGAIRGALWRVYERLDSRMHRAVPDALAPTRYQRSARRWFCDCATRRRGVVRGRVAARGIPKKVSYRFLRLQWFLVLGERDDSSNSARMGVLRRVPRSRQILR
jgi:hypothetical protein